MRPDFIRVVTQTEFPVQTLQFAGFQLTCGGVFLVTEKITEELFERFIKIVRAILFELILHLRSVIIIFIAPNCMDEFADGLVHFAFFFIPGLSAGFLKCL